MQSSSVGEDGPTHQPVEHYWALRAIPNLDLVRPCEPLGSPISVCKRLKFYGKNKKLCSCYGMNSMVFQNAAYVNQNEKKDMSQTLLYFLFNTHQLNHCMFVVLYKQNKRNKIVG